MASWSSSVACSRLLLDLRSHGCGMGSRFGDSGSRREDDGVGGSKVYDNSVRGLSVSPRTRVLGVVPRDGIEVWTRHFEGEADPHLYPHWAYS